MAAARSLLPALLLVHGVSLALANPVFVTHTNDTHLNANSTIHGDIYSTNTTTDLNANSTLHGGNYSTNTTTLLNANSTLHGGIYSTNTTTDDNGNVSKLAGQNNATSFSNTATTASSTEPPLAKCRYQTVERYGKSMLIVNHKELSFPNIRIIMAIEPGQESCYITRRDMESHFNASLPQVVVGISFACLDPKGTHLEFLEDEEAVEMERERGGGKQSGDGRSRDDGSSGALNGHGRNETGLNGRRRYYDNCISYMVTVQCRVSMKSLKMLADMSTLLSFSSNGQDGLDLAQLEKDPSLCDAFTKVAFFRISDERSLSGKLHHLARCAGKLDNVVKITFNNDSLTSFPEELHAVVPNLRSLDMASNNLNSPVDFPWLPGFVGLSRDLSTTYSSNSEYNFRGSFDLETNPFRRLLILDRNNITNLTDFYFQSDFQFISVQWNHLKKIGEHIFDNVSGLQFLSLANNDLESLPETLFEKLPQLRRLDLQGNKLTSLPTGIFKTLRVLEYLNLERNRLEYTQAGLFTKLFNLEKLKLNNNSITEVNFGAFSSLSVKLQSVELQHNPLRVFPAVLLAMQGLLKSNLEYTDIQVLDFVRMSQLISNIRLADTQATGVQDPALQKVVSLRHSKLRSIVLYNTTRDTGFFLLQVVKHFTIQTEGSQLACDCHILNVTHQLQEWRDDNTLDMQTFCLKNWMCEWPVELKGEPLVDLKDEDTYCPLEEQQGLANGSSSCPDGCSCSVRTGIGSIIVDCQHADLSALPKVVPPETRELWLQNNTIEDLDHRPYLRRLYSLKLTANHVEDLPVAVLMSMSELRVLHVDDNWLTSLASDLARLPNLSDVRLAGNPYKCDCHSLWLKRWLLAHMKVVCDWEDLKCSTDGSDGQDFISVPDELFVCKVTPSLAQLAVPIAVPVTLAFVLLTLAVVAFIQRRRLKVMLYVYTGWHPFDHDPPDDEALYDVTVCCDVAARAWVLRNVIEVLEGDGFKVFFYCRDAFVGFTTSENVRHCVKNSRRLLAVLGREWETDDVLSTAVREGLSKTRKEMVHFLIIVVHGFPASDIENKDVNQFVKRGRYVATNDKHFTKKLLYEMPNGKRQNGGENNVEGDDNDDIALVLHEIIGAAENEQDELNHANQERNIEQFNRQVSDNEVNVQFRKGDNLQCQDRDLFQRQIRQQPLIPDGVVIDENDVNSRRNARGDDDADNNCKDNHGFAIGEEMNEQQEVRHPEGHNAGLFERQVSVVSEVPDDLKSVFVWYAEPDLLFALKNIANVLEKRGHTCILKDRDFLVGRAIQDNIVNAAENCARSILVLSKDLAHDDWFTFVFHVVFDCCQQQPQRRVALVLRDDVDVTLFVEEIQQVIKSSATLTEDDPWFWKRLKTFIQFDDHDIC